MKRNILIYTLIVLTAAAGRLFAVEVDIDGAKPGRWTMDLDAAKQIAAEKKLPIMLDFSGSDWCTWCQVMETNVFMKPEWTAYATNNLMMVLLDFPNDESLVPEKYRERNEDLSQQYGIEGFPTYVILDDDGTTELGQLGAGRDKTPASFIEELKKVFRGRAVEQARFLASLDEAKRATYEQLTAELENSRKLIDEKIALIEKVGSELETLQQSYSDKEKELHLFRMEQELSESDFKAYQELVQQYDAAIRKLPSWAATDPARTEENVMLYEEMVTEIQSIEKQLSAY
jgi:thioredoxin-related protein